MPGTDREVSAALLIAALCSYLFYVLHSLAVRELVGQVWRLSRKFVFPA